MPLRTRNPGHRRSGATKQDRVALCWSRHLQAALCLPSWEWGCRSKPAQGSAQWPYICPSMLVWSHCDARRRGPTCNGYKNRGLTKGWFSKRVVLADVPPERKPERGYIRMFPRNENRNEGTFACSPGTKTGTRVHSPKPPFYETALLFSQWKNACICTIRGSKDFWFVQIKTRKHKSILRKTVLRSLTACTICSETNMNYFSISDFTKTTLQRQKLFHMHWFNTISLAICQSLAISCKIFATNPEKGASPLYIEKRRVSKCFAGMPSVLLLSHQNRWKCWRITAFSIQKGSLPDAFFLQAHEHCENTQYRALFATPEPLK